MSDADQIGDSVSKQKSLSSGVDTGDSVESGKSPKGPSDPKTTNKHLDQAGLLAALVVLLLGWIFGPQLLPLNSSDPIILFQNTVPAKHILPYPGINRGTNPPPNSSWFVSEFVFSCLYGSVKDSAYFQWQFPDSVADIKVKATKRLVEHLNTDLQNDDGKSTFWMQIPATEKGQTAAVSFLRSSRSENPKPTFDPPRSESWFFDLGKGIPWASFVKRRLGTVLYIVGIGVLIGVISFLYFKGKLAT